MTVLAFIVRMLGLPLCIVLGMLGYYEGVPALRDIPFADRIPVVRELIGGRVPAERAKAASEARAGYVLESEKIAAEAKAAKLERERKANQIVIDAYQVQLMNLRTIEDLRIEQHEQKIADYEAKLKAAGRSRLVDDADRRFLLDPQ